MAQIQNFLTLPGAQATRLRGAPESSLGNRSASPCSAQEFHLLWRGHGECCSYASLAHLFGDVLTQQVEYSMVCRRHHPAQKRGLGVWPRTRRAVLAKSLLPSGLGFLRRGAITQDLMARGVLLEGQLLAASDGSHEKDRALCESSVIDCPCLPWV